MEIRESWQLEQFFGGDVGTPALRDWLTEAQQEAKACLTQLASEDHTVDELAALITRLNRAGDRLREAESFVSAVGFLDTGNEQVRLTQGRLQQIRGDLNAATSRLDGQLAALPGPEWESLCNHESMAGFTFVLEQRRQWAARLNPEQEAAIRALSVDGHQGWADIYRIVSSRTRVTVEHGGEKRVVGVGQAGKLLQTGDRSLRLAVAEGLRAAYEPEAPLLASALNHLAGYRTTMYKLRGWRSVLTEPLANHRVTEPTLEAMWAAIAANRAPLNRYLERRAQQVGADVLTTADMIATVDLNAGAMEYPEVARHVVRHFEEFHPAMGAFARQAFAEGWIDTSDGPARQPGVSMSISFPVSRQTRVVMNHQHLAPVVAHELGHSYSYRVWYGTPAFSGLLAPSMAAMEVPSTFAQLLVSKGMVAAASSAAEKVAVLGEHCVNVVLELLWRYGSFRFEKELYEARMAGPVSLQQVNQLYVNCYSEATGGTIRPDHPYGWISPFLFTMPAQPFYNFPYTVATLLSAGLYARYRAEGRAFAGQYDEVMADLARMTVEGWAQRHLGGDPSTPDFWQRSIDVLLESVEEYLQLTEAV